MSKLVFLLNNQNFFFLKDSKEMERQAKDTEKMYAVPVSEKGRTSRKYNELLQPNKEIRNPTQTVAKGLKERSQKSTRRWQASTVTRALS